MDPSRPDPLWRDLRGERPVSPQTQGPETQAPDPTSDDRNASDLLAEELEKRQRRNTLEEVVNGDLTWEVENGKDVRLYRDPYISSFLLAEGDKDERAQLEMKFSHWLNMHPPEVPPRTAARVKETVEKQTYILGRDTYKKIRTTDLTGEHLFFDRMAKRTPHLAAIRPSSRPSFPAPPPAYQEWWDEAVKQYSLTEERFPFSDFPELPEEFEAFEAEVKTAARAFEEWLENQLDPFVQECWKEYYKIEKNLTPEEKEYIGADAAAGKDTTITTLPKMPRGIPFVYDTVSYDKTAPILRQMGAPVDDPSVSSDPSAPKLSRHFYIKGYTQLPVAPKAIWKKAMERFPEDDPRRLEPFEPGEVRLILVVSNVDYMPNIPPDEYPTRRVDGTFGPHEESRYPQWHAWHRWHMAFIPGDKNGDVPRLRHSTLTRPMEWYVPVEDHFQKIESGGEGDDKFVPCERLARELKERWAAVVHSYVQCMVGTKKRAGTPFEVRARGDQALMYLLRYQLSWRVMIETLVSVQRCAQELLGWVGFVRAEVKQQKHDMKGYSVNYPADTSKDGWLATRGVLTSDKEVAERFAQFRVPVWFFVSFAEKHHIQPNWVKLRRVVPSHETMRWAVQTPATSYMGSYIDKASDLAYNHDVPDFVYQPSQVMSAMPRLAPDPAFRPQPARHEERPTRGRGDSQGPRGRGRGFDGGGRAPSQGPRRQGAPAPPQPQYGVNHGDYDDDAQPMQFDDDVPRQPTPRQPTPREPTPREPTPRPRDREPTPRPRERTPREATSRQSTPISSNLPESSTPVNAASKTMKPPTTGTSMEGRRESIPEVQSTSEGNGERASADVEEGEGEEGEVLMDVDETRETGGEMDVDEARAGTSTAEDADRKRKGTAVPGGARKKTKHEGNVQTTHEANVQTTHEGNVQTTHEGNVQTTHEGNVQPPKSSFVQRPKSSFVAPKNHVEFPWREGGPATWYLLPSEWLATYVEAVIKKKERMKKLANTKALAVPQATRKVAVPFRMPIPEHLANVENESITSQMLAVLCDIMPDWMAVLGSRPVDDVEGFPSGLWKKVLKGLPPKEQTKAIAEQLGLMQRHTPVSRAMTVVEEDENDGLAGLAAKLDARPPTTSSSNPSPTLTPLSALSSLPPTLPPSRATTPDGDDGLDYSDGDDDDGCYAFGTTTPPILRQPRDDERPLAQEGDRYLYEPAAWRKTDVNQLRAHSTLLWYIQVVPDPGMPADIFTMVLRGKSGRADQRAEGDEWWCYDEGAVYLFNEYIDPAKRRAVGERLTREVHICVYDGGQRLVVKKSRELRLWKACSFSDRLEIPLEPEGPDVPHDEAVLRCVRAMESANGDGVINALDVRAIDIKAFRIPFFLVDAGKYEFCFLGGSKRGVDYPCSFIFVFFRSVLSSVTALRLDGDLPPYEPPPHAAGVKDYVWPPVPARKYILWFTMEVAFRYELYALDAMLRKSHGVMPHMSNLERQQAICSIWASDDNPASRSFVPNEPNPLTSDRWEDRRVAVVRFYDIVCTWPRVREAPIFLPAGVPAAFPNSDVFTKFEQAVWMAYAQTYFDYYARTAPLPRPRPPLPSA
ncbi:hypothetical protein EXIGLDRAFT_770511 [Exidia glandulosa HHB12029]|uniref:Uncharacterized protein n=1 Tax=Exidia glandulosa HHB12029 TaxID=1314781 RepID=A0A165GMV2_EXIGL|nr:hypothetical protein EXIGLDRAFT_770511 [Exidia glandulosa HHB12029]